MPFPSNSIGALEFINQLCCQYEKRIQNGDPLKIHAVLQQVPEQHRQDLVMELLKLEFEYKKQNGETIDLDSYRAQLPEYESVVERAFGGTETAAGLDVATNSWINTSIHKAKSRDDAGQVFGDYELIEKIASGGMGVVYKAQQKKLNREVALKMILSGEFAGEQEIARFLSEAEAAAKLHHPNIVAIHEVGECDGKYFFSMDYIDGKSLSQELSDGPLELRRAAEIVEKVAGALSYAHSNGVIHRDLKPANILIDKSDRPYVTDFGLAKTVGEDRGITITGQVLGTPNYMPPEQALGKLDEVDERADVYSLGAILFALITGRAPFSGTTIPEVLHSVVHDEVQSPRKCNPHVDRDLETICIKCLEKDQTRRYQNASELVDELKRYQNNEPIMARPLSASARAWRWCRRKPIAATALALVVLLAVSGPTSALYMSYLRQQAIDSANAFKRAEGVAREAESVAREAEGEAREAEGLAREAEGRATQSLAEKEAEAAKVAMERGAWDLAIVNLKQALATGHPDPIKIQLELVRALENKGSVQESMSLMEELHAEVDGTPYSALAELMYGDALLIRGDSKEAMKHIEKALEHPDQLPPTDAEFARALISDNPHDAKAHLQKSLELDPFHYRAHGMLIHSFILSGDKSEAVSRLIGAQAMYPNDPNFNILEAMIAAQSGQWERAVEIKKRVSTQLQPSLAEGLEQILQVYHDWSDTMDHWDAGGETRKDLQAITQLKRKFEDLLTVPNEIEDELDVGQIAIYPTLLQIPPCLAPQHKQLQAALFQLVFSNYKSAAKSIESIAEIYRQGEIYFLLGESHIAMKNTRPTQYESVSAAEEAFLNAAESPSIWMNVDREAYYCAAMSAADLWVMEKKSQDLDRALAHTRKRLKHGALRPPHDSYLYAIATRARDYDVARQITLGALSKDSENEVWLTNQIMTELGDAAFAIATRLCDKFLEKNPGNETIQSLRKQAIDGLRRLLDEEELTREEAPSLNS